MQVGCQHCLSRCCWRCSPPTRAPSSNACIRPSRQQVQQGPVAAGITHMHTVQDTTSFIQHASTRALLSWDGFRRTQCTTPVLSYARCCQHQDACWRLSRFGTELSILPRGVAVYVPRAVLFGDVGKKAAGPRGRSIVYAIIYSLDATRCVILHLAATQSLEHALGDSAPPMWQCGLAVLVVAALATQVCAESDGHASKHRVGGVRTFSAANAQPTKMRPLCS